MPLLRDQQSGENTIHNSISGYDARRQPQHSYISMDHNKNTLFDTEQKPVGSKKFALESTDETAGVDFTMPPMQQNMKRQIDRRAGGKPSHDGRRDTEHRTQNPQVTCVLSSLVFH